MQFKHTEDQNFMQNVELVNEKVWSHSNTNYIDIGLCKFINNITKYLNNWNSKDMSHLTNDDMKPFLTPYEIAEGNCELFYIPEKILKLLFDNIPELTSLFHENADTVTVVNQIHEKNLTLSQKNSFSYDNPITTSEEFISELLSKELSLFDSVGVQLLEYITTIEFNKDYQDAFITSFNEMFVNEDDFEFNASWFYKLPRSGSVSHSGYTDMAIHAWIGASDLITEFISYQKKIAFKEFA